MWTLFQSFSREGNSVSFYSSCHAHLHSMDYGDPGASCFCSACALGSWGNEPTASPRPPKILFLPDSQNPTLTGGIICTPGPRSWNQLTGSAGYSLRRNTFSFCRFQAPRERATSPWRKARGGFVVHPRASSQVPGLGGVACPPHQSLEVDWETKTASALNLASGY